MFQIFNGPQKNSSGNRSTYLMHDPLLQTDQGENCLVSIITKISIFSCINIFSRSNVKEKDLILKLPITHFFIFFILTSPNIDISELWSLHYHICAHFLKMFDLVCYTLCNLFFLFWVTLLEIPRPPENKKSFQKFHYNIIQIIQYLVKF